MRSPPDFAGEPNKSVLSVQIAPPLFEVEVPRSGGGGRQGAKASNALFIKNIPPYFFIITDFTIFITDNTLLYCKPLVGDFAAKIVIPTERSDETLVRQCL